MSRPRPGPLLPPDAHRDRPLFFVVTILVFLACLAGLAGRGAWLASENWTQSLAAEATVQVLPGGEDNPDALAVRAAETLRGLKGVAEAEPLGSEESEALLEPWFGDALPEELPAPRLIAVRLTTENGASAEAMRTALVEAEIEAVVDDHSRWESEISRAVLFAQATALVVLGLLAGAAAAVTAFATRASLSARKDVVDALKIAGAEDGYVAGLFQRRFLTMGLKAGALGALIAALAAAGLVFALMDLALLGSGYRPDIWEAVIVAAAPLATGLIGGLTARFAVIAALRESF